MLYEVNLQNLIWNFIYYSGSERTCLMWGKRTHGATFDVPAFCLLCPWLLIAHILQLLVKSVTEQAVFKWVWFDNVILCISPLISIKSVKKSIKRVIKLNAWCRRMLYSLSHVSRLRWNEIGSKLLALRNYFATF